MKGIYKGGPLGVLSHKVKFQQDVKIYSDCFSKIKKDFLRTLQGGGLLYTPSHMTQNFNRTQKHETHSVKTDELGRNMYAHMYEGLKNKNYNPKPKQVQG